MSRRVVMISYSFPPVTVGGTQRSAGLAGLLFRFGSQPLVLTGSGRRNGPRRYCTCSHVGVDEKQNANRTEWSGPRTCLWTRRSRSATAAGGDRANEFGDFGMPPRAYMSAQVNDWSGAPLVSATA